MNKDNKLNHICRGIMKDCLNCDLCVSECQFLQRIEEDPAGIARREPSVEEAYSCSLCGLCEQVCPLHLSLCRMFGETRNNAVENDFISINDYRYMFPDRKNNLMNSYRELSGVDYTDLNPDREAAAAFFPGCTLLTYFPQLTTAIFNHLSQEYKKLTLITDCCGIPFFQLGLQDRGNDYVHYVKTKLMDLKVKKLITACPNCYYQLQPLLEDTGITMVTIYEALENSKIFTKPRNNNKESNITVHDSCPDRSNGLFAGQARKALLRKGFSIVEMVHNRNTTLCCGSGGQVSHFQPELAEKLVTIRLQEAENTGAPVLAAYCLACVLNFVKVPGKMNIQHVLNLLLETDEDFSGLKEKSKMPFAGPKGEEYWEKIMAE